MNSNPTPSPDDNYFIDKVDDPLARSGANSFIGLGTSLVQLIATKFKDKRQTDKAIKEYVANYVRLYGKIKLLGMPQDVYLEEIYTEVKFLD
ncbi:MAG: hypothetical protein AB4372_18945, partial [Xenococcus sp. (in: cyanobacteria)]